MSKTDNEKRIERLISIGKSIAIIACQQCNDKDCIECGLKSFVEMINIIEFNFKQTLKKETNE
jgi:hypothetical protein